MTLPHRLAWLAALSMAFGVVACDSAGSAAEIGRGWLAAASADHLVRAPAQDRTRTVLVVRHAEAGTGDDPALTDRGRERALALVDIARARGVDAIYSSQFRRTVDTARPAAEALGLEVIVVAAEAGADEYAAGLADAVRADTEHRSILVVNHSNTVPVILETLGGPAMDDIAHWQHDQLFEVTLPAGDRSATGVTMTASRYGALSEPPADADAPVLRARK